jgi:hypothetical protein
MEARERATGQSGMERSTQNLPIPLGRLAPAHHRTAPSAVLRWWRRHWRAAAVAVGILSALVGFWLAANPARTAVYVDADGVHVGASLLRPSASSRHSSARLYVGDAALVLRRLSARVLEAATVTWVHGVSTSGVCVMRMTAAGADEVCRFSRGGAYWTSYDAFRSQDAGWVRRYSNGHRILIAVPPGAHLVPVPFAFDTS